MSVIILFVVLICFVPVFSMQQAQLDTTGDGFIVIPHVPDVLKAPSLFASTLACIKKRS
jgi:hypothetical protein